MNNTIHSIFFLQEDDNFIFCQVKSIALQTIFSKKHQRKRKRKMKNRTKKSTCVVTHNITLSH
jgi:hypothetical protein